MEYTEQELSALFDAVMLGASDLERGSSHFRDGIKFSVKLILDGRIAEPKRDAFYTLDLPATLRLMRAAREQDAHEMRERAAKVAEVCSGGERRARRDLIAASIRALTIPRDC